MSVDFSICAYLATIAQKFIRAIWSDPDTHMLFGSMPFGSIHLALNACVCLLPMQIVLCNCFEMFIASWKLVFLVLKISSNLSFFISKRYGLWFLRCNLFCDTVRTTQSSTCIRCVNQCGCWPNQLSTSSCTDHILRFYFHALLQTQ